MLDPQRACRGRARAARRAALGALFFLGACGAGEPAPRRPNVVLISVDSLRADHVSAYGYARRTTPSVDALAAEGALFRTVVSSTSWTLAAHAALFTSLPDSVHGAFRPQDRLPEERVTLAERMSEAGYRTAGFYSGPFLHPAFGLSQGFAEWISCTASDPGSGEEEVEPEVRKGKARNERADAAHEDVTSPKVLAAVQRWFAARDDERPFFLFVHLWDPHYNYIPPPPYDTRWDPDYTGKQDGRGLWSLPAITTPLPKRDLEHVVALYDGEISFTDHHIGLLVEELRARGLLDDTLLIVTGDHGEEFFEHGSFGHHRTLMDECLLVPLVMRWPRRIPAGLRVETQVRLHDVAPTILELAGARPFDVAFGASLAGLLGGAAPGEPRPAFSELHIDHQEALRRPTLQTMSVVSDDKAATYVFDLARDPAQRHRLPESDPRFAPAAAELKAVSEHVAGLRKLVTSRGEAADVPPALLEELRALGYIGD